MKRLNLTRVPNASSTNLTKLTKTLFLARLEEPELELDQRLDNSDNNPAGTRPDLTFELERVPTVLHVVADTFDDSRSFSFNVANGDPKSQDFTSNLLKKLRAWKLSDVNNLMLSQKCLGFTRSQGYSVPVDAYGLNEAEAQAVELDLDQLLQAVPRLKQLRLASCTLVAPQYKSSLYTWALCLEILDMSYAALRDGHLVWLARSDLCPGLRHVSLKGNSNLSDSSLSVLFGKLKNVVSVDLSRCIGVGEKTAASLASLCTKSAQIDVKYLQSKPVQLLRTYPGEPLSWHEFATKVSKLNNTNNTPQSDHGQRQQHDLPVCSGLQALWLQGITTGFLADFWPSFSQATSLSLLDLSDSSMTAQTLEQVVKLPIISLVLAPRPFSQPDLVQALLHVNLHKLRFLDLRGNPSDQLSGHDVYQVLAPILTKQTLVCPPRDPDSLEPQICVFAGLNKNT